MIRHLHRSAGLTPLLILLAGCASPGPANTIQANTSPGNATSRTGMTATERLANDLVEAELAFSRGDEETLSRRLNSIELAGAVPSDESGVQALTAWRDRALLDAQPLRGRVLGPGYTSGLIPSGASVAIEQILLGGEVVTIAAGTAPRAGLRLRITRADGKTVCEQSPAHAHECRFVPTYTQRYRIVLDNSGKQDARYHLVFN